MNEQNNENTALQNAAPAAEKERKEKRINWKSTLIFAVLFVLILAATFVFIDMSSEIKSADLGEVLGQLNFWYLGAGVLLMLLFGYCEGRALAAIGRAVGVRMSRGKSTLYSFVDQFFSGITPSASGGQPAAVYYMSRDGIKLSKSAAIFLNNTMHYTISLLLISTFTVIFEHDFIIREFENSPVFKVLLILGFVANCLGFLTCLLLISVPGVIKIVAVPLYKLLAKLHIIRNLDSKLESLDIAMNDYSECHRLIRKSPAAQLQALLWNIIQKVASCAIAYCVYRAFGLNDLNAVEVICIHIIIVLTVNALPLPGSAGASELITQQLYITIYGAMFAVPAMVLYRTLSFYLMIIVYGVVSVIYYLVIKHRIKKEAYASQT